jgi:MFS family permease
MTAGDRTTPPPGWLTIIACFSGYALNAMDVLITIPAMREAMQASKDIRGNHTDVVLLATATWLSSAVGGWVAGALSDRIGRVKTLMGTIACLAIFTFLCGCTQTYGQLFVCRVLMGVGFGGQWAAAAVMVGEAASPARRGLSSGFMQSGWAAGWALALFGVPAFVSFLWSDGLSQYVSVWRVFFWVSALPALPILCLVHWWHIKKDWRKFEYRESEAFDDTRTHLETAGKTADFLEIFSPTQLRKTAPACMLSIGAMGGYWAIVLWLPAFLAERALIGPESWQYPAMLIAGSFAGYLASGGLSDLALVERRWNFVLFATGAILTVFAHIYVPVPADQTNIHPSAIILALAALLGFFASGTFSGMGAFFVELFPVRMSGSGLGFTYNFGRGFAVLILWLVGGAGLPFQILRQARGGALSQGLLIALFVLIAYSLVIIGALLLDETRGRKLDRSADDPPRASP